MTFLSFRLFRRNYLREQKKDNESKKKKDLEAKKKKRTSMVGRALTFVLLFKFWFRSDQLLWRLPRPEQRMTTWEWLGQKLMMPRRSSSEM